MQSIILKAATRLISGIVLVFAVYLLWRGHHAPGGGFIAALVASTGFALVAIADGPAVVRRGIFIKPRHLMGVGLLMAMGAGALAMIGAQPFFSGLWWPPEHAWIGTPVVFDIGVFLTVLGAIVSVLLALEEG
jgi:multisubunit Na+/H+ antiporter MnhB subunit